MRALPFFIVALYCSCCAKAAEVRQASALRARGNPIRRVVSMLQMMQGKVEAEGKTEKDLFEKFECYCKTGEASLAKEIQEGEARMPQLRSESEETNSLFAQTKNTKLQKKTDLQDAKDALSKGQALRTREQKAFETEAAEDKSNILAIAQAVDALERGASGSFLQTSGASVVRRLVVSREMTDSDRDVLSSFLSEATAEDQSYAPAGGEIIGILKQMKDTMEKELQEAISGEEAAMLSFDHLSAAKAKEISVTTAAVEELTARLGDLGVKQEELKEAIGVTEATLEENKEFIANMDDNCRRKKQEWDVRQKVRSDELIALADTIKLLGEDGALDVFKKALPSPKSFLQIAVSSSEVRQEALRILKEARRSNSRLPMQLDLIALALRGKKVGFEKVLTMIENMISLLRKEQVNDDDKKAYCAKEFDKTEDETKSVTLALSDNQKSIDDSEAAVQALSGELAALIDGIKALDAQVGEATANRKSEHNEYIDVLQQNNAAKELIELAKNRLHKFYNMALHKKQLESQLAMAQSITKTEMPGGLANTGISAIETSAFEFVQTASKTSAKSRVRLRRESEQAKPAPPPETFSGEYGKKTQESTGVIQMMNMLQADIEKQIQEGEFFEAEAQKDYETLVKDGKAKRAGDSKSISDKESDKARLEETLLELNKERASKTQEASALARYTANLHGECDWLLKNFAARKQARDGEIESLQKAKDVLSGADYS